MTIYDYITHAVCVSCDCHIERKLGRGDYMERKKREKTWRSHAVQVGNNNMLTMPGSVLLKLCLRFGFWSDTLSVDAVPLTLSWLFCWLLLVAEVYGGGLDWTIQIKRHKERNNHISELQCRQSKSFVNESKRALFYQKLYQSHYFYFFLSLLRTYHHHPTVESYSLVGQLFDFYFWMPPQ